MSERHAIQQLNPFLTASVGRLFLLNALPMTVVMLMGGILNVVDGIFVGHFIGSDALAAVSLAFPMVMMLSALTILAGGGMSSLMARHLGAGDRIAAARIFAGTHGLVLTISASLVLLWEVAGVTLVHAMGGDNAQITGLAQNYLQIIILGTPVQLMLGVHADALRNEGRAGLIAALSVLVNLLNIGANWLGIVVLDLGVSGSALGTVAAQTIGLMLLIGVRGHNPKLLPLSVLRNQSWLRAWSQIIRLGLPLCLSFIGIALVAIIVIMSLRLNAGKDYDSFVAAYGVVTRLLSFAFMPQMAMALATQTIAGNNAGAGQNDRARAALRLATGVAFLWCLSVALTGTLAGTTLGSWFSNDPAVISAVAEILRPMMLLYMSSGPILVLALYFQGLGQAGLTAALTLMKSWLLLPLLILVCSVNFGQTGIWLAFPIADAIVLMVAAVIAYKALSASGKKAIHGTERT